MKFPPFALAGVACAAALILSQTMIPTAKAQPISVPNYCVQVEWQKAERSLSGLRISGRVINTGNKALTYTQVTPTLCDGSGKVVYTGSGYLTVSPLRPGQSAEFRAEAADAPAFRSFHVTFREAGHFVTTTLATVLPSSVVNVNRPCKSPRTSDSTI